MHHLLLFNKNTNYYDCYSITYENAEDKSALEAVFS